MIFRRFTDLLSISKYHFKCICSVVHFGVPHVFTGKSTRLKTVLNITVMTVFDVMFNLIEWKNRTKCHQQISQCLVNNCMNVLSIGVYRFKEILSFVYRFKEILSFVSSRFHLCSGMFELSRTVIFVTQFGPLHDAYESVDGIWQSTIHWITIS